METYCHSENPIQKPPANAGVENLHNNNHNNNNKLKLDHTSKWNVNKQESIIENGKQKIVQDFGIQMNPLILAKRPDQEKINKKNEKKWELVM